MRPCSPRHVTSSYRQDNFLHQAIESLRSFKKSLASLNVRESEFQFVASYYTLEMDLEGVSQLDADIVFNNYEVNQTNYGFHIEALLNAVRIAVENSCISEEYFEFAFLGYPMVNFCREASLQNCLAIVSEYHANKDYEILSSFLHALGAELAEIKEAVSNKRNDLHYSSKSSLKGFFDTVDAAIEQYRIGSANDTPRSMLFKLCNYYVLARSSLLLDRSSIFALSGSLLGCISSLSIAYSSSAYYVTHIPVIGAVTLSTLALSAMILFAGIGLAHSLQTFERRECLYSQLKSELNLGDLNNDNILSYTNFISFGKDTVLMVANRLFERFDNSQLHELDEIMVR